MKHPHAELIKQWADDTSLVFEFKDTTDNTHEWEVISAGQPQWYKNWLYRIKPAEPKKVKLLGYINDDGVVKLIVENSFYHTEAAICPRHHRCRDLDKEVTLP